MKMNRLTEREYPEIKSQFFGIVSKYPFINAVISNLQKGFVYADHERQSLFICAKHGWSIVLVSDKQNIGKMFKFLQSNMEIPDYIHLYSPGEHFMNYVVKNWPKIKVRPRGQYRNLGNLPLKNYSDCLPDGFNIVSIQDIEFSKLDVFGFDLDKRYWDSKMDFLRNAIGVCIIDANKVPAAIGYSAAIVDNVAEFDVLVLNDYQGMGLGTVVLGSAHNMAMEKGLISHADIFITNSPSIKMALKVGLSKICDYNLVSIFLRDW